MSPVEQLGKVQAARDGTDTNLAVLPLGRDADMWKDRPGAVFLCALTVRVIIATVFLGSCDTLDSIAHIPLAAAHGYFYLPYFPIIDNILGSSALIVSKINIV